MSYVKNALGLSLITGVVGLVMEVPPARADNVLIVCAVEGGTCVAPNDDTPISYGKNGAIVTIKGVTQIGCNNGDFRIDPLVGQNKYCIYTVDPDRVSWTQCATEGDACNFTGAKLVRYGVPAKWVYGSFVNGVGCNNGTFGDPDRGTTKQCQVGN